MAGIKEVVYLTRDNTVDLILKDNNGTTDLTDITKIEVHDIGCAWAVDSVASPDAFDIGTTDGKVVLMFGDEPVSPGTYNCLVIVYDPTNPNGVVWGNPIELSFKSACPIGD